MNLKNFVFQTIVAAICCPIIYVRAYKKKIFILDYIVVFIMKVKEIMHNVDKVDSNVSISEAARVMEQKSTGSILIEKNDKVRGIMTERDILHKVVAKGKNPDKLKVKDIMSSPVLTIDANKDILESSKMMDRKRIRR